MGNLLTNDPVALRSLMTETLFLDGFESGTGMVEEKDEPVDAPVAARDSIPDFMGGNVKNYLFLIDEPTHAFFADADLEAFAKILAAKQLSIDDVSVLNCAHHDPIGRDNLIALFKPKNMVFLGVDPTWAHCTGLTLNVPVVADGIYSLYTYSFAEMSLQNDKKKLFWSLIKQI